MLGRTLTQMLLFRRYLTHCCFSEVQFLVSAEIFMLPGREEAGRTGIILHFLPCASDLSPLQGGILLEIRHDRSLSNKRTEMVKTLCGLFCTQLGLCASKEKKKGADKAGCGGKGDQAAGRRNKISFC